ncbi:MAG: flagellar hook-basal body complex protein FliE [Succinivibrionaceae bacterium]|nr:flagellar hook-basal body complex protein FliE [Succinivibrionaceae bacterium]
MGMGIDASSISTSSIMAGLANMQRQMRELQQGAAPAPAQADAGEAAPLAVTGQGGVAPVTAEDSVGKFAGMLKDAFEDMNSTNNEANSMQQRFDLGDRSMTLADVMLSTQKARLSFEATMQIRNKVVEAYRQIMQMQI